MPNRRGRRVHDEVQTRVGLALVLAVALSGRSSTGKAIETFSIRESFGVAHPRQIVDFDFTKRIDPKNSFMIGPQGVEVPVSAST